MLDTEKCNKRRETIDADRELCIARVLKRPVVGVYEKDPEADGGFALRDINSKGFYDFIGYQDACQGDSGGPYYLYETDSSGRRRAVIVGLVSRGNGCADKNEPGKATRIKHFVEWIQKTIKASSPSSSSDSAEKPEEASGEKEDQEAAGNKRFKLVNFGHGGGGGSAGGGGGNGGIGLELPQPYQYGLSPVAGKPFENKMQQQQQHQLPAVVPLIGQQVIGN